MQQLTHTKPLYNYILSSGTKQPSYNECAANVNSVNA